MTTPLDPMILAQKLVPRNPAPTRKALECFLHGVATMKASVRQSRNASSAPYYEPVAYTNEQGIKEPFPGAITSGTLARLLGADCLHIEGTHTFLDGRPELSYVRITRLGICVYEEAHRREFGDLPAQPYSVPEVVI